MRHHRRTFPAALFAVLVTVVGIVPAFASNDPMFAQQYGLQQVKAPAAWARSRGAGVVIAVVDSGVDLAHPDLVRKLVAGHDFVDGDDRPQDGNDHGTHVAGIAAATVDNGVGIAGVAPDARIMPVRVLDDSGAGTLEQVKAGIRWAAEHGAKVINLSLGPDTSLLGLLFGGGNFEEEIDYAWSKGAVVVVAAGNSSVLIGSNASSGYTPDVKAIVVTATDPAERMPSWANRADTRWSISAPGADILSTVRGGYDTFSGTSMAAPHVAGAAALLVAQGLAPVEVVSRLLATAKPLGQPTARGAGLLDASAALAAGAPPAPATPPAVPVTTVAPTTLPAVTVPPGGGPATAARPGAVPPTSAVSAPGADTGATTSAPPAGTPATTAEPAEQAEVPRAGSRGRATLAAGPGRDDGDGRGRLLPVIAAAGLLALAAAAVVGLPRWRAR